MVLAAGEGTRLRPLTLDRPKPMLPIGEKPLLEHVVTWLRRHGITDIAINLHHEPESVTDYFGDGHCFGVSITYSYEERLLGTAGAARRLQSFFEGTFVVVYGDVFTNLDLTRLIAFHSISSTLFDLPIPFLTLALYRVDNPSACGVVELDGRGRVTRFVEKPPPDRVFSDLVNAGVMVLEPGILKYIPPDTFYDFGRDLFPRLLAVGIPLFGTPIAEDEYLVDIGTPTGYARARNVWSIPGY